MVMQNLMMKKGILDPDAAPDKLHRGSKKQSTNDRKTGKEYSNASWSDMTIYHNVLRQADSNQETILERDGLPEKEVVSHFEMVNVDQEISFKIPDKKTHESTSSEEPIDTSDELREVDCEKFIADCQEQARRDSASRVKAQEQPQMQEFPGDRMIKEVKNARARVFMSKGKDDVNIVSRQNLSYSAMDEEYLVIDGHADSALQQKIIDFEYIDFARLIPKDRIARIEEYQCFELVVKGNSTFFAPVSE